jgi:hypothetical protein
MSSRLEEFIRNHKEEFDDKEASDKVWANIGKALDKDKKEPVPMWNWTWRVAAVFFFLTSSWFAVEKVMQYRETGGNEVAVSEEYKEFVEADHYYTALISQKKQEIEDFRLANSDLEEEFLQDVNKLDSMYMDLKKELKSFQYNEKLMDAVIRNLQLRVEILNQQISLLQRIQQKKQQEETVSI